MAKNGCSVTKKRLVNFSEFPDVAFHLVFGEERSARVGKLKE